MLLAAGSGQAGALPAGVVAPSGPAVGGPFLHYQARLLDPTTGQPKPDGPYQTSFKLYGSETGGSPLWTEAKDVTVSNGVFSTLLGDVTPLNLGVFDGRALWLGITVGADPEATPRQPVAYAAYALYARNAGLLNGQQSSAFAGASHQHTGADITTGVVAEPRIDPTLARDAEVMSLVLGRDGAGSTLDADLFDGQQATAFAGASHQHAGVDISTGVVAEPRIDAALARDDEVLPLVLGRDGAGSGFDADLLDGQQAAAFASTSHDHFGAVWSGNNAQLGFSISNLGAGDGMRVYSNTSQGNYAAIYARNTGASPAIDAASSQGYAIKALGEDHTGVYGETNGDWSWKSGVHGVAKKEHAMGVLGENTVNGVGVRGKSESGAGVEGTSVTGVGVRAASRDGTLIEARDLDPDDLRFYVRNDGWVFADGPYITPAADVAEMLPATADLEPGDVLVVNWDGKLIRSTAAYQPTVVGVYSTKPGFVGGHDDDVESSGSIPLAVVGVVPVKVTTENGAIVPGDLLVTSFKPGHAMKAGANPPQGTVIGKAIMGLDASQDAGVIDMLANLQ